MAASLDHLLRPYLDARLTVSRHLDDPTPVDGAWTAQRALEYMLLESGWTDAELDEAFTEHERDYLLALDAEGWRGHLAEALAQSTDRSLRVAQALARYRQLTGGLAD